MDRLRLGRALGFGARAAAKTLVQAADAAMSPNPSAAAKSNATTQPAASNAVPKTAQPQPAAQRSGNIAAATSRMGHATWEPVKRHSRELWLEVTGSFFALLAFSMATGMWALHKTVFASFQAARTNHAALWSQTNLKFYIAAIAFLMFAYFAVSNFVRARRSGAAARRSRI